MTNYHILRDRIPFDKLVWVFDIDRHIFEHTCERHNIRVRLKTELSKPNEPYLACIYFIPKKHLKDLPDIMDEVTCHITLLGYKDYEEYSTKTIADMLKEKEEQKNGQKS